MQFLAGVDVMMDRELIAFAAGERLLRALRELPASPEPSQALDRVNRVLQVLADLDIRPDLWRLQNAYFQLARTKTADGAPMTEDAERLMDAVVEQIAMALQNASLHAEVVALRDAAAARTEWRLEGCTLVVTLEPCTMCAGALVLARVSRLVYGADDPKAGAVGSLWDVVRDRRLNHRPEVVRGVRAEESTRLLRGFFADQRGP